ncbi:MAG TPA: DUF58 domain-containing protein [Paenibacillus sp.]|jgi:uncharacterized protein (DUF58 family)
MKARMIEWGVATLVLGILLSLYSGFGGGSVQFLLILTIMIMAAGLAIQLFGARNIEIKRSVNPLLLSTGHDAEVVVHVQFQSFLPLPWLTVTDFFTGGTYCKLIFPGFSRSFTYSYTLSNLPRGIIVFQQCYAEWGGLFGWFGRNYILKSHEEITVFPVPMVISKDQEWTSHYIGDGVSEPRDRYLTSGTRGPEARDYAAGDPLSKIHWKSSARRGRLQTILPEEEENKALIVILDHSLKGYDLLRAVNTEDDNVQSLFECAVSVATGLLLEADEAGVETELACKGGSLSFLNTLATITLEQGDRLPELVNSTVGYAIKGSRVAIVTGGLNARIAGVVTVLQGAGLVVDIYCVQPIVSLVDNDYIHRVTRMGIKVYDVQGHLKSDNTSSPIAYPADRMIWKGGAPYANTYPESSTAQEQRSL